MGDTFNSNPVGSTIAVQRMISLAPLPDGRWAATLSLYEGLDLRYKYTLGGPHINAELGASGEPVARQIVLGTRRRDHPRSSDHLETIHRRSG